MRSHFEVDGSHYIPNLMLCCPDRKTQLGVIFPANNIELTANFNSTSELTFTVPKFYFDVKTGDYIYNKSYNDIKPQMLVEAGTLDRVFSVPVFDEHGNIVSNEEIGLMWWVIGSTDETYNGISLVKKVICYSYEHTLKRRSVYLTASENAGATSYKLYDANNETIYALQGVLPNDGTYFRSSFDQDILIDDGSIFIPITKSTIPDDPDYSDANSVDKFLTLKIISKLYTTEYGSRRSKGLASIDKELEHISSLLDKYSENNGVSKDYYLTYTTYESITGLIKDEASSWSVGSVSPDIRDKYSYIEDTSTNIYDLLVNTVSKNYECFPVFDGVRQKIHLLSKQYYVDLLSSGFHLGWNNCIKESSVTTDQNEPCTALSVYSANTSDYDMGLINPTGNNIVYNFGEYLDYMKDDLRSKCETWTQKLDMFEIASAKVGSWVSYYTQQKQRLYSKVATALEDYCDVAAEINVYLEDDGYKENQITESMSVSNNLTSNGWYRQMDSIEGKNIPFTYDYLYGKIAESDHNYITKHFHSVVMLKRLTSKSLKYYKVRFQYDIAAFKYYIVSFYRQIIFRTSKLKNKTDIKKFMTNYLHKEYTATGDEEQAYRMYRKVFSEKNGYKGALNELSKIFAQTISLYPSIIVEKTAPEFTDYAFPDLYDYCKGLEIKDSYSESTKKRYSAIKDYFNMPVYESRDITGNTHFNSAMDNFGGEYTKDIDKYIMNGVYTNSEIKFPDISDISTSGVISSNNKLIIDGLKELKKSAQEQHKKISKVNYEFSITPVNFVFLDEYQKLLNELYLGSTIKAEVSPDNWQEAYVLGIKLNYDNPSDIELTLSSNYDLKPLKYRFADLYNQTSINTSISNTFTSDLY